MPAKDRTLAKFGLNVRRFREAAGLTQEQLAASAQRDITYISGIERGLRNPSLLTTLGLAKALKLDVSKLLEGVQP